MMKFELSKQYIQELHDADLPDYLIQKYIKAAEKAQFTDEKEIFNYVLRCAREEQEGKAYKLIDNLPQRPEDYELSDRGMSQAFADAHRYLARYNVDARSWFVYDGAVWTADVEAMQVFRFARLWTDALLKYSGYIDDADRQLDFRKCIIKYGSLKYRKILVEDARSCYPVKYSDFDVDDDLFNCRNGVLNLRTFEFAEHRATDLLSKISNVVYDTDATAQIFPRFLDDVMQGDQDKKLYLQKLLGYCLTAETELEKIWILYGHSTRNGKSTLVETISYLLGGEAGYSVTLSPESLARSNNSDSRRASGDIARLDGARFVAASEPPRNMILNVSLIKNMSGGDTLTARQLYERQRDFKPKFKLVMNTNYLPVVADLSLFASDRVVVIPFLRHFGEDEQDLTLKARLKETGEISGIFNWMLDGLKLYRKNGMKAPSCIKDAVTEYRNQSDKLGLFFSECMYATRGVNCNAGRAFEVYQSWCDNGGYSSESKRTFFDELRKRNRFKITGVVKGVTVYNVIPNFSIIRDMQPEEKAKYGLPVDAG